MKVPGIVGVKDNVSSSVSPPGIDNDHTYLQNHSCTTYKNKYIQKELRHGSITSSFRHRVQSVSKQAGMLLGALAHPGRNLEY